MVGVRTWRISYAMVAAMQGISYEVLHARTPTIPSQCMQCMYLWRKVLPSQGRLGWMLATHPCALRTAEAARAGEGS